MIEEQYSNKSNIDINRENSSETIIEKTDSVHSNLLQITYNYDWANTFENEMPNPYCYNNITYTLLPKSI